MGIERHLSTQTAILIAGAMVAVGLFFGLRASKPDPPPASPPAPAIETAKAPVPASASSPQASADPPPTPSAQSTESAPAASVSAAPLSATRVGALVANALDVQKKAIVDACVRPALEKQPKPATIKLSFSYTFDAAGKQLARGVSEDRATARPEVTACILEKLQPLTIDPPGITTITNVDWVLP